MKSGNEVGKLAKRVFNQVGKPDGLDAEVLARGYLELQKSKIEMHRRAQKAEAEASRLRRAMRHLGDELERTLRQVDDLGTERLNDAFGGALVDDPHAQPGGEIPYEEAQ